MTAAELARCAAAVGLDVVGAAPAAAYEGTEEHIRERRAQGLFADMKFTMAQPEVSCHPERLLDGAAQNRRLGGAVLLGRRARAGSGGGPAAAVRLA